MPIQDVMRDAVNPPEVPGLIGSNGTTQPVDYEVPKVPAQKPSLPMPSALRREVEKYNATGMNKIPLPASFMKAIDDLELRYAGIPVNKPRMPLTGALRAKQVMYNPGGMYDALRVAQEVQEVEEEPEGPPEGIVQKFTYGLRDIDNVVRASMIDIPASVLHLGSVAEAAIRGDYQGPMNAWSKAAGEWSQRIRSTMTPRDPNAGFTETLMNPQIIIPNVADFGLQLLASGGVGVGGKMLAKKFITTAGGRNKFAVALASANAGNMEAVHTYQEARRRGMDPGRAIAAYAGHAAVSGALNSPGLAYLFGEMPSVMQQKLLTRMMITGSQESLLETVDEVAGDAFLGDINGWREAAIKFKDAFAEIGPASFLVGSMMGGIGRPPERVSPRAVSDVDAENELDYRSITGSVVADDVFAKHAAQIIQDEATYVKTRDGMRYSVVGVGGTDKGGLVNTVDGWFFFPPGYKWGETEAVPFEEVVEIGSRTSAEEGDQILLTSEVMQQVYDESEKVLTQVFGENRLMGSRHKTREDALRLAMAKLLERRVGLKQELQEGEQRAATAAERLQRLEANQGNVWAGLFGGKFRPVEEVTQMLAEAQELMDQRDALREEIREIEDFKGVQKEIDVESRLEALAEIESQLNGRLADIELYSAEDTALYNEQVDLEEQLQVIKRMEEEIGDGFIVDENGIQYEGTESFYTMTPENSVELLTDESQADAVVVQVAGSESVAAQLFSGATTPAEVIQTKFEQLGLLDFVEADDKSKYTVVRKEGQSDAEYQGALTAYVRAVRHLHTAIYYSSGVRHHAKAVTTQRGNNEVTELKYPIQPPLRSLVNQEDFDELLNAERFINSLSNEQDRAAYQTELRRRVQKAKFVPHNYTTETPKNPRMTSMDTYQLIVDREKEIRTALDTLAKAEPTTENLMQLYQLELAAKVTKKEIKSGTHSAKLQMLMEAIYKGDTEDVTNLANARIRGSSQFLNSKVKGANTPFGSRQFYSAVLNETTLYHDLANVGITLNWQDPYKAAEIASRVMTSMAKAWTVVNPGKSVTDFFEENTGLIRAFAQRVTEGQVEQVYATQGFDIPAEMIFSMGKSRPEGVENFEVSGEFPEGRDIPLPVIVTTDGVIHLPLLGKKEIHFQILERVMGKELAFGDLSRLSTLDGFYHPSTGYLTRAETMQWMAEHYGYSDGRNTEAESVHLNQWYEIQKKLLGMKVGETLRRRMSATDPLFASDSGIGLIDSEIQHYIDNGEWWGAAIKAKLVNGKLTVEDLNHRHILRAAQDMNGRISVIIEKSETPNGKGFLKSKIPGPDNDLRFSRQDSDDIILGLFQQSSKEISLFLGSDLPTILHEFAHAWRQALPPESLAMLRKWAHRGETLPDGDAWTERAEERFAEGFLAWATDPKAKAPEGLEQTFKDLGIYTAELYKTARHLRPGVRISPVLAEAMEQLYTKNLILSANEDDQEEGRRRTRIKEEIKRSGEAVNLGDHMEAMAEFLGISKATSTEVVNATQEAALRKKRPEYMRELDAKLKEAEKTGLPQIDLVDAIIVRDRAIEIRQKFEEEFRAAYNAGPSAVTRLVKNMLKRRAKQDIENYLRVAGDSGRRLQILTNKATQMEFAFQLDAIQKGLGKGAFKTLYQMMENPERAMEIADQKGGELSPTYWDLYMQTFYSFLLSSPTTLKINTLFTGIWTAWNFGVHRPLTGLIENTMWSTRSVPKIGKLIDAFYYQGNPVRRDDYIAPVMNVFSQLDYSVKKGGRYAYNIVTNEKSVHSLENIKGMDILGKDINSWQNWYSRRNRLPYKITRAVVGEQAAETVRSNVEDFIQRIGPIISFPTTAMRASDMFFKTIAAEEALTRLIEVEAAKQFPTNSAERRQWVSDKLREYNDIDKIPENLRAEWFTEIQQAASYNTFMDMPGAVTRHLLAVRENMPMVKLVIPFMNTLVNLGKRGLEMTPGVGILAERMYRMDPQFDPNQYGHRRADIIAKQMEGMMMALAMFLLLDDDELTGDIPIDAKERAAFLQQGKLPYSIKFGDRWYSYQNVDPFNVPLAMVANLRSYVLSNIDNLGTDNPELQEKVNRDLMQAGWAIGTMMINNSFMRTYGEYVSARTTEKRQEMIGKTVEAAVVPYSGFLRWIQRQSNAYQNEEGYFIQRNRETIFDRSLPLTHNLLNAMFGLPQTDTPRLTVWGEPYAYSEVKWWEFWWPAEYSQASQDPVDYAVAELGYYPSMPSEIYEQGGKSYRYSPAVHQQLVLGSGQDSKEAVRRLINTPSWNVLRPETRLKRVKETVERARAKHHNKAKAEQRRLGLIPINIGVGQ